MVIKEQRCSNATFCAFWPMKRHCCIEDIDKPALFHFLLPGAETTYILQNWTDL